MKTKLLQEIYSQVDENTKKKLEKEYPHLIKKPFDAWYVSNKHPKYLIFNKKHKAYGLNSSAKWKTQDYALENKILPNEILATKEQILERLIPQAKRRELVNIDKINLSFPFFNNLKSFKYYENRGNVYNLSNCKTVLSLDGVPILKDGVWAEVIKECENPTKQKELITDLKTLIEEYENNVEL